MNRTFANNGYDEKGSTFGSNDARELDLQIAKVDGLDIGGSYL